MVEQDEKTSGINNTVSHLRHIWGEINPEVALICGSGWGELSEIFPNSLSINYSDIPGFSSTTVEGHEGILRLCEINQKQILLFQGRRHLYEGEGWDPIRLSRSSCTRIRRTEPTLSPMRLEELIQTFKWATSWLWKITINFMGSNPLIGAYPSILKYPDFLIKLKFTTIPLGKDFKKLPRRMTYHS